MSTVLKTLMLLLALMLSSLSGQARAQDPVPLSPQAEALIAPVAEAITAEEAQQAALPPPADVGERLERMGQLDQALFGPPLRDGIVVANAQTAAEIRQPAINPQGWINRNFDHLDRLPCADLPLSAAPINQGRRLGVRLSICLAC